MCLAVLAHDAHPRWRLVLAANRDEFHARPADPLARWSDGSGIIAGRDVQAGGTWLGITEASGTGSGRLALVTNFRVPGYPLPGRPSRGALVTDALAGMDPATAGIAAMNPCNLLVLDNRSARFVTNHPELAMQDLPPGLHGLSNGALAPPWEKTRRTIAGLGAWLAGPASADPDALFAILRDEEQTASVWADGGPEPRLSSAFIRDPVYGTRCSTVVLIDHAGAGTITERRFGPDGAETGATTHAFRW